MMRDAARLVTLGLVGLAVAGCGGSSTGPGAPATLSVALGDRLGSALAQGAADASGAPQAVPTSFSGSFSGTAQAYAYSSSDGWVEVGAPAAVTFDVQGLDDATFVTGVDVPEGTYTKVRVALSGFSLHIDAGAVLGGTSFTSAVDIAVGGSDGSVEIELPVTSTSLSGGSSATIHVDLNSEAWVNQTTAEAGSVGDAEVVAAATAEVSAG
jgi:hypothetical protein